MKNKINIISICLFFVSFSSFGQYAEASVVLPDVSENVTVDATPDVLPTPATLDQPQLSLPKVLSNAGKSVFVLEKTSSASQKMRSIYIMNNDGQKTAKALVELTVTYYNHVSSKKIVIESLSPGELREIGTEGVVKHETGKVCSNYRLIAASFE